ncbi:MULTISPECIES: ferritin-like domain-containing protein [Streptomyces]|uniref:Ferritin-like domain-containing protein n=1 Tax=Streptomyces lonegramiae TaxID=3075524 RepID=A0ABU2XA96_9ACTN|nr:ferritin-like domain-containing protein [Streptomyces sp. DSM 41529]MDT0542838.1 ferritin-like domain-containing protein [Streptomyces sp. DSM 41529]
MTAVPDEAADSPLFVLDAVKADLMKVESLTQACLNWDYGKRDSRVWSLYEKNKAAQWNASTDIDWDYDVQFGAELTEENGARLAGFVVGEGSPVPRELLTRFRWEYQAWMCSQFLHGEQGALVTTARLVETVPDMDAKTYAASQVADEARHVEAFARYMDEKLGTVYPVNPGLGTLLHDVLSESRWDIVYLGMQVVMEGLAITGLRLASSGFGDPLIRQITKMVASDEARHIAFGVTSLTGMYEQATTAEIREREDFLLESIRLMSRRFMLREVWERMDLDVDKGLRFARTNPMMATYRQLLFQQVIHVLRQLGLLSERVKELLLAENLVRPEVMTSR